MSRNVNLITSGASLLSGGLDECLTPEDESCVGGIAAVTAFARNNTNAEPQVTIQKLDKNSPFVNMHPLQWVVNRLILNQVFGLDVFMSNPSLLLQNNVDSNVSNRDISDLQAFDFPLLLSNSVIPPINSWFAYSKAVHFDQETGLAIASLTDENVPLWVSQVEASRGILNHIAKINREHGCDGAMFSTDYQQYLQTIPIFSNMTNEGSTTCWVPVLLYSDVESNYLPFLEAITRHENPPGLIVNLESAYKSFPVPQYYENTNVWVGTCPMDDAAYCQHRITVSEDRKHILDVKFVYRKLAELPTELKDAQWNSDISTLRVLADDAKLNNPVLGYSEFMPITRIGDYRACQIGECPLGNLYTDAVRWFTDADVAFTSSGGYRGEGWPEGPVRLTELYAGLPFPNPECYGTMSGVSLFKLLNYTTSVFTSDGGRLMQVSGMKVAYNTLLEESRLIAVDVWDKVAQSYQPLDRLKMYKFATDSYVCSAYNPYPALTGGDFAIDGEIPGIVGQELLQNIVARYLSQLTEPYDTSIQGRLRNDTSVFDFLNLVQDEHSCSPNTVWIPESLTCFPCPAYEHVTFSDELLEFQADNDSDDTPSGRVVLVNRETFGVTIQLKSSPSWVKFTEPALVFGKVDNSDKTPIQLSSGESLVLEFDVLTSSLVSGTDRTALGTVSFGVEDGGSYPGCSGLDATFDISLRVTPAEELNQLGSIRYAGIALMAIVFVTTAAFVSWVHFYRKTRIVKVMQPIFLLTVCFGVFILSSSIIPMSLDDGIISEESCDIACMAMPWLLSMGFTVSFSALFSKLWRINKLFNGTQGFRRIVVTEKDVLAPFAVLFVLNLVFLMTWTFADPLRWERESVGDEDWNTIGSCAGGTVSKVMLGLLGVVNFGALFLACSQAYQARNISNEFSESKYIGIAIYGWLQILIVGIPIIFLIDQDNPTARYFLQVALIFIVSMSMLLIIFVPAFVNFKRQSANPTGPRVSVTGIERSSIDSANAHFIKHEYDYSRSHPHLGNPLSEALATVDELDSSDDIAVSHEQAPVPFQGSIGRTPASSIDSASNESSPVEEPTSATSDTRSRKREIEKKIKLLSVKKSVDSSTTRMKMEEWSSDNESTAKADQSSS
jgi:hypothetical protein